MACPVCGELWPDNVIAEHVDACLVRNAPNRPSFPARPARQSTLAAFVTEARRESDDAPTGAITLRSDPVPSPAHHRAALPTLWPDVLSWLDERPEPRSDPIGDNAGDTGSIVIDMVDSAVCPPEEASLRVDSAVVGMQRLHDRLIQVTFALHVHLLHLFLVQIE